MLVLLIIAVFFIAAVLAHLVKNQNGARRDHEFYELMAAQQHNSERAPFREFTGELVDREPADAIETAPSTDPAIDESDPVVESVIEDESVKAPTVVIS